jgi:DNA-binding transcriptional LysR family regulator
LTRVLSYQVEEALGDGRLVRVLADDESPALPASLIYPGQGRLPMKTRAFVDHAAAQLRQRLRAAPEGKPAVAAKTRPAPSRRRRP